MARTGSSAKFVPVNLNNSYGQALPLSNGGGTSASAGLGRSRSFGNYGGMVSLSRSSRVPLSPSPSSSSVSRASKLAVPRPMNLPSLRREHSGNDPTIPLVGSHGSSGWNKQSGDDSVEVNVLRSDAKGDARSWTNGAPASDGHGGAAERRLLPVGRRQSAYSPPGDAPIPGLPAAPIPVVKAVVFRGEDFPTLQAAASGPSPPSLPPVLRSRDSQQKHRDSHKGSPQEERISLQKGPHQGDGAQEATRLLDRHLQPAQPLRMQPKSALLDQGEDVDRNSSYHQRPSPLIKLSHTSNWADDERETLSSIRTQDSAQQGEWGKNNDGFHTGRNWSLDSNADFDYRWPALRATHQSRNESDFSMHTLPSSKISHVKDVDLRRDYLDRGRIENNTRGDIDRSSSNSNFGRNDMLRRGWSFPATDPHSNRELRYTSPSNRPNQDGYLHGRSFFREGNNVRHDVSSRDIFSSDGRPASQHQDGVQWHDSKNGKDVFQGRQGCLGGAAVSGPRSGRGLSVSLGGSEVKNQSGVDRVREKRVSGFYGQVQNEDPFLGDGIGGRPPAFYVSQPKTKKNASNGDDYRDPARESFEAELERVEKMLEQERQRAIEERERALELARKEQEEQERIAREEEEMRRKVEEEAREAAYRAQKEAEETARKVEEARRARDEEKRMAESEEQRRKESARRKLLALEERIAKREFENRQEDALQKERVSNMRPTTKDVSKDSQESWSRKNEAGMESRWKSISSLGKPDQGVEQVSLRVPVSGAGLFPRIVKSPREPHYTKEENEFSTEGVNFAQTRRKESPRNSQDARLVQRGPPKFLHSRTDRSQLDNAEQQRAPLLRNGSPPRLSESRASDDTEERDWWVRDNNGSVAPYTQNPDFSEFPSYGRIRQSLPKQPRVLPPPPGNAMPRRQSFQADEIRSEGSASGTKSGEGSSELNEGNGFLTEDGDAGAGNQDALVHVSEQFDALPSEEVVLSDAGSQFSDDSIEDVADHAEQEPELHSDIVSESFSDREVDEISDLTEAQESSEDGESVKPAEDQIEDCVEKCREEASVTADESLSGLLNVGKDDLATYPKIEEQVEDGHCTQNSDSNCLMENPAAADGDDSIQDVPATEKEGIELRDGQEIGRKGEELTSEKTSQDQEMHPSFNQAAFFPLVSNDASQIRSLEGRNSRQSLVQQFQQPFSFMAVPLPQSGTHSHMGASLPTLSTLHTLPSQQDLPFHVQLGLLPPLPLLPNAIQVGSIQMPLHVHPQLPQLTHLGSHQQAPVFQFGQIGPSLALNQPIPMTQVPPASMQMLNASGQNISVQHSHLQLDAGSFETNFKSAELNGHQNLENVSAVEGRDLLSAGHESAFKNHAETARGPLNVGIIATINTEKEIEACISEPGMETAIADTVSQQNARSVEKVSKNNKLEPMEMEGSSQIDHGARPAGRSSRGDGRRRSNPPRYRGILGRGQGRFYDRGVHRFASQVPPLAADNMPDGGKKRFYRGKVFRRSYRRPEYRVREPSQPFDLEMSVPESFSGPSSNVEDAKESGGYRYVKRGSGGHTPNNTDEIGQSALTVPRSSEKMSARPPVNQTLGATSTKSKNLMRKYEVDNAEDAPFQTGVVRVFEQPGIETPNDKDDFIKVRSKRQLLRELRQQREKENTLKSYNVGSKDLAFKKQPKSLEKIEGSSIVVVADGSKNNLKKRHTHNDGKSSMRSSSNGTAAFPLTTSAKRSTASSKVASVSKAMTFETEGSIGYGNGIHASENLTTAAWGGQQSYQEVVSLTQIQLEEAMKPFRLDVPFPESVHTDETILTAEPVLPCSSSLTVEKAITPVRASDPLSSLLAGEKIQFGAVTSPTLIPPENYSSNQPSSVRTGSSIDFGSNPPRMSSHTSNFVTSFLDSHLDATYPLKEDSQTKDDNYEEKVVDLEAEAAAEAAASAVVAAAINSEELIDSHSNARASEMNASCTPTSSGSLVANAISNQTQNTCASDNPIAVALPADLSVETSPSLFQGSPITVSNSQGVVLQSLQSGAPSFPCLEMGPLIGGSVYNFGPREDPLVSPIGPGLSGWQQRHLGAPDSYYGSPPFLNSAGLSSIQGHPHMLVYTNPYTPVGQFGQLGVSFMGASYHPSGKQPDWTYVPLPAATSGAVALKDGNLSSVSNGMMTPQHHAGASNLIQTQRGANNTPSVVPAATPPSLFDTGFAAPFQVSQMDGLVQSHWSKAPAPPMHGLALAGSPVTLSLSRPGVGLNVHPHALANQGGHLPIPMEGADSFHQVCMRSSATGSPFSSAVDASAQFPDELGLGDSMPTFSSSSMQSDACARLSDVNHLNVANLMEASGLRVQCGQGLAQCSQGHLDGANETNREMFSSASYQEQNRNGVVAAVDSQNKAVGRVGSPGMSSTPMAVQLEQQRTSKQAGQEWNRGTQRKGGSGRAPILEKGASLLPSKLKQIYVAKPAGDSRKIGAACS